MFHCFILTWNHGLTQRNNRLADGISYRGWWGRCDVTRSGRRHVSSAAVSKWRRLRHQWPTAGDLPVCPTVLHLTLIKHR